MSSVTIRDVPNGVLDKIRALSARDRRSMNKEMLVLLEAGLEGYLGEEKNGPRPLPGVSAGLQLTLWRDVCGKWDDDRSTDEIIADIRNSRTMGREVSL